MKDCESEVTRLTLSFLSEDGADNGAKSNSEAKSNTQALRHLKSLAQIVPSVARQKLQRGA